MLTPLGGLFRLAAVLRRFGRRPIEMAGPLASDDRQVERRMLVARLGQRVAGELLYYEAGIALEALGTAQQLLRGPEPLTASVGTARAVSDDGPQGAVGHDAGSVDRNGLVGPTAQRIMAALVVGGACLLILLGLGSARAGEGDRRDRHAAHVRPSSVVVAPQGDRIDLYDRWSNRIGYGIRRPDGSIELFRPDGRRLDERPLSKPMERRR